MKPQRNPFLAVLLCPMMALGCCAVAAAQTTQSANPACSVTNSVVIGPRLPGRRGDDTSSIQGVACNAQGRTLPGVEIIAVRAGVAAARVSSNGEGIFRLLRLPPGTYVIQAKKQGYTPQTLAATELKSGELLTLKISLEPTTAEPPTKVGTGLAGTNGPTAATPLPSTYPTDLGILKLPTPWPLEVVPELAPIAANPAPDRWNVPMPDGTATTGPASSPTSGATGTILSIATT